MKRNLDHHELKAKNRDYLEMICHYETTMMNSYQPVDLKRVPRTTFVEKPEKSVKHKDVHPKYVESLFNWKPAGPTPFSLFIYPDPVNGTDPRVPQKPYEKTVDVEREKVQKTRPRVLLSPAVCLDDIENPEERNEIIQDMYQSEVTNAQKFTNIASRSIQSPFGDTFAPTRPLDIPKLNLPYVSTEWRKETVEWDRKQVRGGVDPTKEFWNSRTKQNL